MATVRSEPAKPPAIWGMSVQRYCLSCLDHSPSHHAGQRFLPNQPGLRPLPTILREGVTPWLPLQP